MSVEVAIPGQPARPAPMPAHAPAQAIAAVAAIDRAAAADHLFGFLDPRIRASWDGRALSTWCAAGLTTSGRWPVSITWRWGRLWQAPDWYETGWHPDARYLALKRAWARRVWDTLNPGKASYVSWGRRHG